MSSIAQKTSVSIKQGDTLIINCEADFDISDHTILSKIKYTRNHYEESFVIDKTAPEEGKYTLTLDTSDLPLGKYEWDIVYDLFGVVSSTDTKIIEITRAVTNG